MFNFNVPRYEGVVNGALAQRPKIEKFVDEVCNAGYSNLYLIGVGGTWAHYLPIQFLLETNSSVEVHVAQAAESDALVHDQPLDLHEDGRMRRVDIVYAENAARA